MTNITQEQEGQPTMTTAQKVINVIIDKGDIVPDAVVHDATFTELGFDSLDTVELIMEFEAKFNIKITDLEAQELKTVGDAIAYIESHI